VSADVRVARISDEPLDVAAHLAAVADNSMGAVTSFIGTVRDADPDAAGEVVALEYTAHPDAEMTLRRLAESSGDDVLVAVSHRVGRLGVGEPAVVIAVASGHRAAAFAACRALIEAIKTELPVWKRQVEADGTTEWKGLGG
jgi:molybdopterin synthase catalytic subunit